MIVTFSCLGRSANELTLSFSRGILSCLIQEEDHDLEFQDTLIQNTIDKYISTPMLK